MLKTKKMHYEIFISERTDESFNFRNREEVFMDIVVPLQPHGSNIFLMMDEYYSDNIEADGIVTSLEHTPIAVKLADCNGVIIMWKKYFWVVHAGWKWLKNQVIEKCVEKLGFLGEKDSNLEVYIGPSIRSCCYEVGNEFKDIFEKKYLKKKGKKLHLDMLKFIEDIFKKLGITKVEIHSECTKCGDNFFSYRGGDEKKRFLVGVKKI